MAHITIFSKLIRTLDGLYSLNDLHKAAGDESRYQPVFFIRTKQTQELVAEIQSAYSADCS
ncbi:KilA-N domain-containing protein [Marinomonas sp. PE14-40]|uniref:KilA-N domain-containing protein n=1 Tax=Marinomonas sp. PE14-40 TaxID=3060621 RepID=UPI003F67348D